MEEKKKAVNMAARCSGILRARNVAVAEEQRHGREGAEDGVEQWQGAELGSRDVGGCVEVDEPADECAGEGADDDDGRWDMPGGVRSSLDLAACVEGI